MADNAIDTYWRALAMLRLERNAGLHLLEDAFAKGSVPSSLDGRTRGRLLATTVGHGVDVPFEAVATAWMPWKGKTFDSDAREGRNIFADGVRKTMRITLPTYRDAVPDGPNRCTAFRFLSSVGPSALDEHVEVLRIDYRDVPENPAWPIRRVLDEVVAVGDGIFLGQALLAWRGQLRRAAWFCLEEAGS